MMTLNESGEGTARGGRRAKLKAGLVGAGERAIMREGVAGLRARALAEEVGCAVGAIYNVVKALDDLVLLVNAKTLAALKSALGAGDAPGEPKLAGLDAAIARLVQMALAYLDFAAANMPLWRALFD